jgi:hypothetical protein
VIVIFNGPPGSGKDEAALYFEENYGFSTLSFKEQLFKETIEHFGVNAEWFMEDYGNREIKEKPCVALNNMSRRQALIYVSEEIIKPKYGKDYFGNKVAEQIEEGNNYVLSDGGFMEELLPLFEKVGPENVIVIQLTREGHDYSSDSRRYINGKLFKEYTIGFGTQIDEQYVLPEQMDVCTYRIHNNGSIRNYHEILSNIFEELKNLYELK